MPENAILIATGTDRPGIVDELSQFLLECGGNITDSRAINLHGQFALLLLVRGERPALDAIRAGLAALSQQGIEARLQPANGAAQSDAPTFPHVFVATGKDQAGVVHRISHLLRALKVNIDEITTHVAGDGSFQIRLALAVPRETPVTMLRDYLSYLCVELGIKGELKEA